MGLCSRCQLSETAQPCVLGGRKPCAVCQEDMELERTIQELQERRRVLRTQMNALHDPFILKFPPEISSDIFLLSMDEWDHEPYNLREYGMRKLPTPFLLSAVCKGWRELAHSTPELWATFSLTLAKPQKIPLLQTVRKWLQLSGRLPLAVWIFYQDKLERKSHEMCVPVIDAVNEHSGRWHKIVLYNITRRYLSQFRGTTPPSRLYDLQVINRDRTGGVDERLPFKMDPMASPTNVIIEKISLSANSIGWGNLTTLEMKDSTVEEFMEILQRAPLLEHCFLSKLESPTSALPKAVFRHTRLKKLDFYLVSEESVIYVVDALECPSLEKFGFFSCDCEGIADNLISLFKRSASRLEELELKMHVYWQKEEDFKKLLNAVPYLRHLYITWNDPKPEMVDGFLQQLSSSAPNLEAGTPILFPHLESLSLSLETYRTNKTVQVGWKHIPAIYGLPQRKHLNLELHIVRLEIKIDDEDRDALTEISKLIDEGVNIQILKDGKDYFPEI